MLERPGYNIEPPQGFQAERHGDLKNLGDNPLPILVGAWQGAKRSAWRSFTTPVAHLAIAAATAADGVGYALTPNNHRENNENSRRFQLRNTTRHISYKLGAISPDITGIREIEQNSLLIKRKKPEMNGMS